MDYIFQAGLQLATLRVLGRGKEREIKISTALTGFKFAPISSFFKIKKKEEYEKFKKLTRKMNEKEFEKYVVKEFAKMGYRLVRKR